MEDRGHRKADFGEERRSRMTLSIGVLISGQGSNLQALIDQAKGYQVRLVISNEPEAYGLVRAQKAGIPHQVVSDRDFEKREDFEAEIIRHLDQAGIELVVLAGFMRILSKKFVEHYQGRMVNIHPALLPAFPGTQAIEKAFAYGVKVTGVTTHFVDEGTDTGPIILQQPVLIEEQESLESLTRKIHQVEHQIYPETIRLYASDSLKLEGRKVIKKEIL